MPVNRASGSEHNLTPDQRAIPRACRRYAYQQVPETCDTVRNILDAMGAELAADLRILPEDGPALDAAISRAMQRIRDEVTNPLRTAQMRAVVSWFTHAGLLNSEESEVTDARG